MPIRSAPRHVARSTGGTRWSSALAGLVPEPAWNARRLPAAAGTWRGTLWTVFVSVCFLGMSHPKILEDHMPTIVLWLWMAGALVAIIDAKAVRVPALPVTVVAFLGFCLVSLVWTTDADLTGRATLYYLAMALLAGFIATNTTGDLLIRGLSFGVILVVALSGLAIVAGHPIAVYTRGDVSVVQGLYGNRNIFAYVLLFGLCAVLSVGCRTVIGRLAQATASAVVLIAIFSTQSATGLLAAVLMIVARLVQALVRSVPPRRRKMTVRVLVLVAALGAAATLANLPRIFSILGKNETLTGRTPLWEAIIDVWWQSAPLQGEGWGAVWTYAWFPSDGSPARDRINELLSRPLNHGHNAVLDILIQVGLVGVILYCVILVVAVIGLFSWAHRAAVPVRTWSWLVILALLVAGLAEPLFATPIGWFHVVLVGMVTARRPPVGRDRRRLPLTSFEEPA